MDLFVLIKRPVAAKVQDRGWLLASAPCDQGGYCLDCPPAAGPTCDRNTREGTINFLGEQRDLDHIAGETILEKWFEIFQVANYEEDCSGPEAWSV